MKLQKQSHSEGAVAKAIEQQTAKLPSDTFLWLALGSIGTSLGLRLAGKEQASTFVAQWAPTFLLLGVYNKIVKVAGSDQTEQGSEKGGRLGRGSASEDRSESISSPALASAAS